MNDDNPDDTRPIADGEPLQPLDQPADPKPARNRWRDRAYGIRGLAAVAIAGLLLGGAGGTLVGATAAGGDGGDRYEHGRWHEGDPRGPEGRPPGPPPGGPGGVPPSTAPSQDEDSQPDSGGTTSGDNT